MFWERFYEMCFEHGIKPNPLGKEIGISSGIISKWKTEGTLPNGDTLLKISDRLNCSVDYLLGRTNNPQAHKCGNNADTDNNTLSSQEAALLELFRGLDVISQARLIAEMADKQGK